MSLHPDILDLLAIFAEKKSISIEEKQVILSRSIELNQDLKIVVSALEKIEQTNSEKSSNLIKCSACGEIIPALDRVCPSCKNVKSNSSSIDLKLDDLIFESETLLSELKSSDSNSFSKKLLLNASVSSPLFIGASFVLGWNFNSDVLAGIFFCSIPIWILVIRRLRRSLIANQRTQNVKSFEVLNSEIEKKIRLLDLYFGNDSRTKDHITQLKLELTAIKSRKKKLIFYEIGIYIALLLSLIIIGYFTAI